MGGRCVVGGRCRVVGGRCRVVGGRCRVVGGRCRVVGGRCRVVGGRCRVVGGRCSVVQPVLCSCGGGGGSSNWLIFCFDLVLGFLVLVWILCCFLVYTRMWKGPSEWQWVGLGYCPFCTVPSFLPGWMVDGFTRSLEPAMVYFKDYSDKTEYCF